MDRQASECMNEAIAQVVDDAAIVRRCDVHNVHCVKVFFFTLIHHVNAQSVIDGLAVILTSSASIASIPARRAMPAGLGLAAVGMQHCSAIFASFELRSVLRLGPPWS